LTVDLPVRAATAPVQILGYEIELGGSGADVRLGRMAASSIGPPGGCRASRATYCLEPAPRQGLAPSELFTNLQVGGQRATVTHGLCCVGEFWSIDWSVPSTDSAYTVTFRGDAMRRFAAMLEVSPSNAPYARILADFALTLIPISFDASESGPGVTRPSETEAIARVREIARSASRGDHPEFVLSCNNSQCSRVFITFFGTGSYDERRAPAVAWLRQQGIQDVDAPWIDWTAQHYLN
jgi:hypothetical protein